MNKIILATTNMGKIMELRALLSPIECVSQKNLDLPEVDENGLSFVENAIIKARHVSKLTGQPCLADDSGLVVERLQGKPGIYSSRFAGPNASDSENIELLLKELITVPREERKAYFYCAMVLVQHAEDPTPYIATGRFDGIISEQPSGENGFGYDPVFYIPEKKCTMAELPTNEKNSISHRAKAIKALLAQL